MRTLIGISWAILIAVVFFGAIEIQTRLNAEIDKRADNKLKGSWCNVDFGSSSATIECEKIERLEHEAND